MSKQLYYKTSIDKYQITYDDAWGNKQTIEQWGSKLGIEEWIAKMEFSNPTFKIIEKGIVQEGQPIPEWSY